MRIRRLLPLPALAAIALGPGAAQAHDTTSATLQRPSEVRELNGTVVFSAFDPAVGAYRLTVHGAQGTRALPVQPSRTPFEADIGTNSKGAAQVVFSLDVGPQAGGQAGGRDLFVLTLGGGAPRPVRNANTNRDESSPTIDGGRIAFTRVHDEAEGTREDNPVVYTKRLVAPRERPSTRLPGVPRRRDGRATTDRSVSELELKNGRLGQIVRYTYETAAGFLTNEVREVGLSDRRSRGVGTLTSGLNGQFYVGLSFAEGFLAWYETSIAGNDSAGAYRYRPGRGYRYAEGPPHLSGFAWTSEDAWQVRCRADGVVVGEDRDAPCALVHVDRLEWRKVDADRVR